MHDPYFATHLRIVLYEASTPFSEPNSTLNFDTKFNENEEQVSPMSIFVVVPCMNEEA